MPRIPIIHAKIPTQYAFHIRKREDGDGWEFQMHAMKHSMRFPDKFKTYDEAERFINSLDEII